MAKKEDIIKEDVLKEEDKNIEINTAQETAQSEQEETVKKTVEELLEEEKDKSLRLFAEFENYKKRTTKERIELYKTASKELMSAMLPVLDDVERAYKEIAKSKDKSALKGLELIKSKLFNVLEDNGLERMDAEVGEDLDTDKHEAITKVPAPNDELRNKIIDCIEVGYSLNGKVIRFAKVVMGE